MKSTFFVSLLVLCLFSACTETNFPEEENHVQPVELRAPDTCTCGCSVIDNPSQTGGGSPCKCISCSKDDNSGNGSGSNNNNGGNYELIDNPGKH